MQKNLTTSGIKAPNPCSVGLCLTLDKLGVPHDSKWRALILYMRSISDFDFFTDTQKAKIQDLVVKVLQEKRFDDEAFYQLISYQEQIINESWRNKLQAALNETEALLKNAQASLGNRKGDLQKLENTTVYSLEQDHDVEIIISNIKKGFQDVISHLEQDARDLVQLSQTDELTCLGNRRAFEAVIDKEAENALKTKEPLCLAMFDIDHFKRFNDEHGHLIGDQALAAVGKMLREFERQYAKELGREFFAARFGGEEFTLLMPGTEIEEAASLAETLRARIERFNFTIRDPDGNPMVSGIRINVSTGVAELSLEWTKALANHLVDAADQALYQAKTLGRNRVCVFGR